MSQTSYPRKQAVALPGQLSDSGFDYHKASFRNDNASAGILFGCMTGLSATEGGAATLAATDTALAGIVIRDHAYDIPNELDDDGLQPDVVMTLLQRGRIWVTVEETVVVGDPVRVRCVVAGSEVAGVFRKTADSTDCVDISAFARWVTGGSAAAVAELEINMLTAGAAVAD